ncbi:MAG: hypothetical protein AB1705_12775 [Verrucomicrobiota bacterium]
MNVLDENIPKDQADLLAAWKIRFRSLSRDLGAAGISDEDILPLLLNLKRPTFLTRDEDFFVRDKLHAPYSLVWFDVATSETAFYIRRFLRHPQFNTITKRLGKVIAIRPSAIQYWTKNSQSPSQEDWVD